MKFDGVKCDECGAIKKDVNHWFIAIGTAERFTVTLPETSGYLQLGPGERALDLCSESCASKAMSRAIGANTPRGKEGVERTAQCPIQN
jgi:hypothetical protein